MTTAKVRIAVALDAKGEWSASGWGGRKAPNYQDMKNIALEGTEADPVKVYWLEAELPIPTDEENTVIATVADVEDVASAS
jgi:hypothetical protein